MNVEVIGHTKSDDPYMHNKRTHIKYNDGYYIISSSVGVNLNETLIFKSNEEGYVTDWRRTVYETIPANHERVLEMVKAGKYDKHFTKCEMEE